MDMLGEELKRAREAAGLSLKDMAARTKIAVTALEALERDDFSRLPGGIFGRSFVRAYAIEVGADPDTTMTRFMAQLEASEQEAAARRAARLPEISDDDRRFVERQKRALVLLRVLVVVAVAAMVALIVWQLQVRMAAPDESAVETTPRTSAIVPPVPADPVPPALADAPTGVASSVAGAPFVIEFDVTGECWISMGVDGGAPVARLFRAGDQQRVEAVDEVILDVGNAGALRLTINGRPGRALGGADARVRTRITRQNLSEFLE